MRKVKFILLGLGAAFAISAMATASASALSNEYFTQPSKAIVTTEKVVGSVGVAQFQSTIAGQKIIIECKTNALEGGWIDEGASGGTINYTVCGILTVKEGKKEKPVNCKVHEAITFPFKDRLITQSKAGVVADEFYPPTGEEFVKITIEGAGCLLNGTYHVVGTYTASLGDQAEEDQTEHELVFNEGGSNVQFESKAPAAYTNTVSHLHIEGNTKEYYVD